MTDADKALQVLFQNVLCMDVKGYKIPSVGNDCFRRGKEYVETIDSCGQVTINATFRLIYDNDNAEDMRDVELVLDYLCSRGLLSDRPDTSRVTPPQKSTKVWTTYEDLPVEGCLP